MGLPARWTLKTEHRYAAFDGRLYLERPPALSPNWNARCCHESKQLYKTTQCSVLADAQHAAEKWFLGIQARIENNEPVNEPTVRAAYVSFVSHHEDDLLPLRGQQPQEDSRLQIDVDGQRQGVLWGCAAVGGDHEEAGSVQALAAENGRRSHSPKRPYTPTSVWSDKSSSTLSPKSG